MKNQIILLLLLVTGLSGTSSSAGPYGPARTGLEAFSQDLHSLKAAFVQTIVAPDGSLESESSGEVWLQQPGLFRWSYGGDFPELIVADGEKLWMYDPTLEQVTVKAQSGLAENSPLMLLTDLDLIDEQFSVTEVGDFEGVNLLELVSLNPESEFDKVMLGFKGQQLALMSLEDAFGLRTQIRFSDIERNPELDAGLFHFIPPENTDVVGDFEGQGPE
ncbi:MAG: outer membrane lipoprotein carrier protein [Lysobacterales bacterium]|jgi:outer membrane lipoprotein carrier protein